MWLLNRHRYSTNHFLLAQARSSTSVVHRSISLSKRRGRPTVNIISMKLVGKYVQYQGIVSICYPPSEKSSASNPDSFSCSNYGSRRFSKLGYVNRRHKNSSPWNVASRRPKALNIFLYRAVAYCLGGQQFLPRTGCNSIGRLLICFCAR